MIAHRVPGSARSIKIAQAFRRHHSTPNTWNESGAHEDEFVDDDFGAAFFVLWLAVKSIERYCSTHHF